MLVLHTSSLRSNNSISAKADPGPTRFLLSAGVVDVGVPWEVRLAPGLVGDGLLLKQLLQCSLQHVPPEPFLLAVGSHHSHGGLHRLLGLPVHPLDQSFVLVYEPVYCLSRIGLPSTATGQLHRGELNVKVNSWSL